MEETLFVVGRTVTIWTGEKSVWVELFPDGFFDNLNEAEKFASLRYGQEEEPSRNFRISSFYIHEIKLCPAEHSIGFTFLK